MRRAPTFDQVIGVRPERVKAPKYQATEYLNSPAVE